MINKFQIYLIGMLLNSSFVLAESANAVYNVKSTSEVTYSEHDLFARNTFKESSFVEEEYSEQKVNFFKMKSLDLTRINLFRTEHYFVSVSEVKSNKSFSTYFVALHFENETKYVEFKTAVPYKFNIDNLTFVDAELTEDHVYVFCRIKDKVARHNSCFTMRFFSKESRVEVAYYDNCD